MTSPDSAESLDAKQALGDIEHVAALREACIDAPTPADGIIAEQELRDELLENGALLRLLRLARLGMKAEAFLWEHGHRLSVSTLCSQEETDRIVASFSDIFSEVTRG